MGQHETQQYWHDRDARGKERKQGKESLFEEILTGNFPNLVRERIIQVEGVQRVPIKMKLKRPISRHVTIKMSRFKDKERIVKAAREKQLVTYKGTLLRLSADFSKETL